MGESVTDTAQGEAAFNPLEPGYVEWPYKQFARLRAQDPVHRSELLHGWVLTRYDDIVPVLRDQSISSDLTRANPSPIVDEQLRIRREYGRGKETLVLADDPDHARLRRLMSPPFRPRSVQELHGMVAAHVDAALETGLLSTGSMDVVADFAYPLPVSIFCEMLGIPDEDSPKFRRWTKAVARGLDPVMEDTERAAIMDEIDDMYQYLSDQAEAKRANPEDDILSMLVHFEEEGDRLSHEELLAQLLTLYVAGHEPTAALIGNGLLALLRQPDQLALLRDNPALMGNAVLELLRYDGPNQFVRRIATQPMPVGDREIGAGDVIYACLAAGNHDPGKWGEDAECVRLEREDADEHLQFGTGIHSCLGSHLARLQAEVALGALLARLDHMELAGEPRWSERMVLRAVDHLPITFTTT
jgi:cytochrome P450